MLAQQGEVLHGRGTHGIAYARCDESTWPSWPGEKQDLNVFMGALSHKIESLRAKKGGFNDVAPHRVDARGQSGCSH